MFDPFLTLPSHGFMAQWAWNGFKPCPHVSQECSGWKGSQSEHNCVTDTKKSVKTCQKWPKIAQTMAIFHHKWLILWRKKNIFINIQLPMGSGQLLIPFGYLEVPLPAACSLVRRALWNTPAPLAKRSQFPCLFQKNTEFHSFDKTARTMQSRRKCQQCK